MPRIHRTGSRQARSRVVPSIRALAHPQRPPARKSHVQESEVASDAWRHLGKRIQYPCDTLRIRQPPQPRDLHRGREGEEECVAVLGRLAPAGIRSLGPRARETSGPRWGVWTVCRVAFFNAPTLPPSCVSAIGVPTVRLPQKTLTSCHSIICGEPPRPMKIRDTSHCAESRCPGTVWNSTAARGARRHPVGSTRCSDVLQLTQSFCDTATSRRQQVFHTHRSKEAQRKAATALERAHFGILFPT